MSWFKRLFEKRADTFDQYWSRVAPAMQVAGVTVTPDTAESVSAVYAAVSAISESVASLPLEVYRRTADGREKARNHPLYSLLHDAPNERQTALEFREMLQRHVLLRGNGFAEVMRAGNGRPIALVPIHPDRVSIFKSGSGALVYEITDDGGKTRRLVNEEILHLRYHSDDGIWGRSPIQVARGTIGLALAEREHGASLFQNGTKFGGVIHLAAGTTREQAQQVADSWRSTNEGVVNHGKTPILPFAAEYKPISMTLEDAEWIEARKMSVKEVARLFRVPPPLIGELEEANYSNVVELQRYFTTHTLKRHLVMWEQSLNRVAVNDSSLFYVEHNVEGLLRGDSLTRAQFYDYAIKNRWMLRSEVRSIENLPRIEGIDDAEQQEENSQAKHQGMEEDPPAGAR